ncbi:Phage head morphogenesis domain [uncultured Caudovirales phage]|uniref:Phage head morphogenesis domain n=1 Tax=uncultured Caudovirales phage TaxID=2100421 RepID=A0A6J5MUM4_9CAUD|nr:Phage head morphogenesis domain [uncultured Caudovirales phage]
MVGKTFRSIAFDAKKKARADKKDKFKSSDRAEKQFYRQLKKVAQYSGHIVDNYVDGVEIKDVAKMMKALEQYAKQLEPWAVRQSSKLLEQVSKSNKRAYQNNSKAMGAALRSGVAESDDGAVALSLLYEQVDLIKSLPTEAGLRAQRIAAENFLNGTRAMPDPSVVARLKQEMEMTTEVAVNRAKLIARTETARANASFVQARAAAVGVTHYVWRTTMDGAERHSHAKMNGKVVPYAKPPTLSDGTTGHAGTFPNCRCWQDPVLPDID